VGASPPQYELQSPSRIQVYVPLEQTRERWGFGLSLLVKTETNGPSTSPAPLASLVTALPRAIAELDVDAPLSRVAPLQATVDQALAQPILLARTASVLGALALLLAGVGVFALASFGVAQRLREMGIRQALGATPRELFAGVLDAAIRWFTWGTLLGLAGAAAAAAFARTLLYGVGPFDLKVHIIAVAILAFVTLLASAAPALRAARVDPATILREEA
jgi:hypothetical protein